MRASVKARIVDPARGPLVHPAVFPQFRQLHPKALSRQPAIA